MRLDGCIYIFCIAEYGGTQDMYHPVTCRLLYIYIYARGCTFFVDIVSFVRTWMRFMICLMLILHMDASSSRLLGTWMPLFLFLYEMMRCIYD